MKRWKTKSLAFLLALCMMMNTLGILPIDVFAINENGGNSGNVEDMMKPVEDENKHAYDPFSSIKEYQNSNKKDEIDETTLMVKVSDFAPDMTTVPEEFAALGVTLVRVSVDATTPDAMEALGVTVPYRWITVGFSSDIKASDVALKFAEISYVLDAEYNFIRRTSAIPQNDTNPLMSKQWHLQSESVKNAWKYLDDKELHDELSNVVVAVIDTGVDYTHPNLLNSMWVNVNEIPGDGIDNDGNGYADDVYGVSTIGNIWDSNGDPMDEMGHGTHVAGIIAASADSMGAVGLAYGAKIMAIKAAGNSGIFNDSDIIEGINYAISMGADVINMSFGSYSRSAAIEDALAVAYTSAVLVAAAGNEGYDIVAQNMPVYPASYNYVIGVMASDENGAVAAFSNTDGVLRRNSLEYEVSAPGAQIFSMLPDGRYASWSGTSMASPYVAAVAAILRAKYNDKSVYSTRYLMGQIVGTAKDARMGIFGVFPIAVDVYAALTETPEPDLSYYDYYIFDDPAYSETNNGDGIIDAGETIGLGVLIRNHWGQARNTKVTLVASSTTNSDEAVLNPHVTWIKDTVEYGDVGTYVTANNGFTYDTDGVITSISDPFLFEVSENIPNDYPIIFSLIIDCETYTEYDETKKYTFDKDTFTALVRKGIELPRRISQNMTLTADKYYILAGSTLIESGVTVTVEPGTQIQFWGDYSKELYAGSDIAELLVEGEFLVQGSPELPVDIFPSPSMPDMEINIRSRSQGRVALEYCNIANPQLEVTTVDHCYFVQQIFDSMCRLGKNTDGNWYHEYTTPTVSAQTISNSIFYEMGYIDTWRQDRRLNVRGTLKGNLFDSCGLNFQANNWDITQFSDNVFLKNSRLVEFQIDDRTYLTSEFSIQSDYKKSNMWIPMYPVKNPETGSTYFVLRCSSLVLADEFAKRLGGSLVSFDDYDELDFVLEYAKKYYAYNKELGEIIGSQDCKQFYELYIGFYLDSNSTQYIGQGSEGSWLDIGGQNVIPYIQTGYSGTTDENIITNAYVSYRYLGTWEYDKLLNENPSDTDTYSTMGMIIEIPGEITPISIDFDADALTIPSNTTEYQLFASVYPDTDNYTLEWSSSDDSVVTVDQNGKITAHKTGVATVTVSVSGTNISDEILLVITQYYEPTGFSDDKTELFFDEYQEKYQLAPVVTPDESSPLIEYVSSDTSVAVVSNAGIVTAVGSGSATVTAKIANTDFVIEYTVTVAIPPENIEISSNYIICALDETTRHKLTYNFTPSYATVGKVEYISSDESIVTVDENGVLTPVSCGNANVWISFPDIDKAIQARVIVVKEEAETFIVSGSQTSFADNANSVLYSKDNTTYVFSNDSVVNASDTKLPQVLPVKTLQLGKFDYNYGTWIYIDTENKLYICNTNNFLYPTHIADNVAGFVNTSDYSNTGFFYKKMDGSIWYYNTVIGSLQNEAITNIVDMEYYRYNEISAYLFLDAEGNVWYENTPQLINEQSIRFSASILDVDEKIKFISNRRLFSENGVCYRLEYADGKIDFVIDEFFTAQKLQAFTSVAWEDVEDIQYYSEINTYVMLLNDGRVVLAREYTQDAHKNLNSYFSNGNQYVIADIGRKISALGYGSFIAEDGSVLMYGVSYSSALGNGKGYENYNRYLNAPVSPWIGMVNDMLNISFEALTYTCPEGTETLTEDLTYIPGKIDPNVELVFTLSKIAESTSFNSLFFRDPLGNRINAVAKLDSFGKHLIVKPEKELTAGYDYTLQLPGGVMTDVFGNHSLPITVSMTVVGEAVYDVPVTGIEGAESVTIEYAENKQLSVNVLPENATLKKVYWTSSDDSVVTVNTSGLITGHNNGTAKVTARTADGSYEAVFDITVSTNPETVSVITGYFQMAPGESGKKFKISIYPTYADMGTLTYISNDESVVKIAEDGTLTAVAVGSTLVGVTSSKTQETYYALVEVLESPVVMKHITYVSGGFNIFIDSTDTVWYITGDGDSDQNKYLPRKASFKAKEVYCNYYWSRVYYIALDDTLCYKGNMSDTQGYEIAKDVVSLEVVDNYVLYLKKDGTVWVFDSNTNRSVKCTALQGISIMEKHPNSDMVFFINANGECRYTTYQLISGTLSSKSFVKVDVPENDKIRDVIVYSNYNTKLIGESGNIYSFYAESIPNCTLDSEWTYNSDYQNIKDKIVAWEYAWFNNYSSVIALLNDGTVYYIGYRGEIPYGLSDCVEMDTSGFIVSPINGISGVKEIARGYFLLEDGTIWGYQAHNDSDRYQMGNNNYLNQSFTAPVTSWFGANDDNSSFNMVDAFIKDGENSENIGQGEVLENISVTSLIEIAFNKQIFETDNMVSISDLNGKLIPLTVEIKNNKIVLIPKQNLEEGMIYTVTIPADSIRDVFGNGCVDVEIGFITTGERQFEIPVTGIDDINTTVNLSYGEEIALTPTIIPDNASVKRVTWRSSDSRVASVNQSGIVTGGQNGTATITATTFDGEYTVTYTVTVSTKIDSFKLADEIIYLSTNENDNKLTGSTQCILTPEYLLINKEQLIWYVADESIATVDSNGVVTAVSPGMTALYCKCEGIDEVAVCIISVFADLEDIKVNDVYKFSGSYDRGNYIIYKTDNGLWLANSNNKVPKFIAASNVKTVAVCDIDYLMVLKNDGCVDVYYIPSGELVYENALEDVEDITNYYHNGIMVLMKDKTLRNVYINGSYNNVPSFSTPVYSYIDNILAMHYADSQNKLYLLHASGSVWYTDSNQTGVSLYFKNTDTEKITLLPAPGGDFMQSDIGKLYPLKNSVAGFDEALSKLESLGVFEAEIQIDKIAYFSEYSDGTDLLILDVDGRLMYFGYYFTSHPLSKKYEYTESTEIENLYYLNTDKAVSKIGHNFIIFEDGSVDVYGQYFYFGNAIYTDYIYSSVQPYFVRSNFKLNEITLNSVKVGDSTISLNETTEVEISDKIIIETGLPLVATDEMSLISVQGSDGSYINTKVEINGRKMIINLLDNLEAGKTYTVKIFADSIKDIFNNTKEFFTFDFKAKAGMVAYGIEPRSFDFPSTEYSPDWSLKELQLEAKEAYQELLMDYMLENNVNEGNAFLNAYANPDAKSWMEIKASGDYSIMTPLFKNYWGTTKTDIIDRIIVDVKDSFENPEICYDPFLAEASESAYPFVTGITVKNSDGEITSSVGLEEITIIVSFNRDMDMEVKPFVSYGGEYPYGDFAVEGNWVDARTWEGKTKITAVTGSGMQYFKVRGAVAADDSWLVTGNDYERFAFEIATSGAKSMSMQANSGDGYVELQWEQDDFETLAGYNVYRYQNVYETPIKLNSSIISADTTRYVDYSAETGVQYYYYFTVVNTDFTESDPSGEVMASARDTTAPQIEHSTISSAPRDAAISIVAYISDNMAVQSATLYYRIAGTEEYSAVSMYPYEEEWRTKYTATIPANIVKEAGVEYYIEASDGIQSGTFCSEDAPIKVTTYSVFSITVRNVQGGKVNVSKIRAKAGEMITVSAIANSGYAYLANSLMYSLNGESVKINNGVLIMPDGDIEITASFLLESSFAYGDINRDGLVDSADAILLLRYDAALVKFDQEQILLADVNRDGLIDLMDASEILRMDAGLNY